MTPSELRAWEEMARDGSLGRYVGLGASEARVSQQDYIRELRERAQRITGRAQG